MRYLATIFLLAAGCSSGFGPREVVSPDPSAKIPAIKREADGHDLRHVEQMVKDLENDDPAVRFYAIGALSRMTDQTFGYRYYDDEDQRAPSILKWKEWLAHRQGQPSLGSVSTAPTSKPQ